MHVRTRTAAAVVALLLFAPSVATAAPRTVLSDVHTDAVHVRYDGGALSLGTRIGTPPYEFAEADAVLLQVKDTDAARLAVPDLPEYAFLGAPGGTIWMAPQVQDPTLLFAGWDTEALPGGVFADDAVDLHLRGVTGPGALEVFQNDEFGMPIRVFSSTDQSHRTLRQGVGQHVHANWAFTALGRYTLTFEVTGTVGGQEIRSGSVDYTWLVGDVVPDVPTTTQPAPTTTTVAPTTTTVPPTTTTTTTTTKPCVPITTTSGVVLEDGHVDYAARIVGGRLTSQVKDGTVAGKTEWRSPSQVVFRLKPESVTTVPSAAFGFLGPVAAKIWQIPQTQKPGVLWMGWNTEEISGAQASGEVSWALTGVDGPGSMAIYELDSFGQPKVLFNSRDGLPDSFGVRLGTHAHGNWAFTAEGAYRITFTQTAKLATGESVSDTQVVTFAVGSADARSLLPKTTGSSCASGGDRAAGLANTGVSAWTTLLSGLGLLVFGAALLLASRRRVKRA
jgi:surface-anchored protein